MAERTDHKELDRLLSSGSGYGDGEPAKLARLARAVERNRPPLASPSAAFRDALRGRLLQEARTDVVIPLSLAARVRATVAARNARLRRSFRVITATAAAAAMLLVGSAAFAYSEGKIPGEAGYSMKRFRERMQMAVTFDNAGKAQKQLDFARKRLDEIRALRDAGVESTPLYTATFRDMDTSTSDATSRLIREFRSTKDADVLNVLIGFSQAQRASLESLMDQLPPGARPSARSSIELVVAVQDRVSDVLGGCPCSADVLVPSGSSGPSGPAPCTCSSPGTEQNGLPRRTTSGSGSNGGGGTVTPTPPPSPGPTPTENPRVLPDVPDTTLDDTIDDVLDDLISPSPLPSLPLLP